MKPTPLLALTLLLHACGSAEPGYPPHHFEPDAGGPQEDPLAAPANLRAEGITSTSIELGWDAVPRATGYEIFAGTSPSPQTLVGEVPTSSAFFSPIEPGATYFFRVLAKAGDERGPEATLSVTVPAAAPEGLVVTGGHQTWVSLAWASVAGASAYRVLLCEDFAGETCEAKATTEETSARVEGLTAGTVHFLRVRALSGDVEGTPSTVLLVTTVPEAPEITGFSNPTDNSIQANFTSVSGATDVRLQIGASEDGPFFGAAETFGGFTKLTATGLRHGETYYLRAGALNDLGAAYGAAKAFTMEEGEFGLGPAPQAPFEPVVEATSPTTIEVTWSGSYSAGSLVNVLVSADEAGPWVPVGAGDANRGSMTREWFEPETRYCVSLETVGFQGGGSNFSERTAPLCVTTPAEE